MMRTVSFLGVAPIPIDHRIEVRWYIELVRTVHKRIPNLDGVHARVSARVAIQGLNAVMTRTQ